MLSLRTAHRLAIAIAFLGGSAIAQDESKADKTAAATSKVAEKDPNAKPQIPKDARVDATVWGAVVYAKKGGESSKMPKELPDLDKRLGKIKQFADDKSFEVIGQHTQKIFSEYTNWVVPSKQLFLNVDSKGPAKEGGMNLHVQLWSRTKVLVKTDTTLKKASPLIIGGPKWRDGQLVFVLMLK